VEFFASLFDSKRAVKRRMQFLSTLERLQDGLGDLNDIAVHEERIAAMGTPSAIEPEPCLRRRAVDRARRCSGRCRHEGGYGCVCRLEQSEAVLAMMWRPPQ
jgi:CHAD domain-containing protein